MNYKINFALVEITHSIAIEEFVAKKIALLEKHLHPYTDKGIEMFFDIRVGKTTRHHKAGDIYMAEITFRAGGDVLHVKAVKNDMYAAIDAAKNELQKEMQRHKGRHIALIRRGAAKIKEIVHGFLPKNRRSDM
jgi:ribosomal subunit interface protein